MEKKLYTVKEVCEKYSVTRKTLFYYDRINLIKPYSRQGVQQHKMYNNMDCKHPGRLPEGGTYRLN